MITMQAILAQLNELTPEEQLVVQQWIREQQEKRAEQRKKELWGNVIAAINKYEKEIGDIEIVCRNCGDSGCFDSNYENEPGCLFIS